MDKSMLLSIGGSSYCLFPWLGTRAFRTLKRFLKVHASTLGISNIESFGCCYITFKMASGKKATFLSDLLALIRKDGMDPRTLIPDSETPISDKYDDYIPAELLREAYAKDHLSPDEVFAYFVSELEERSGPHA